MMRMESKSHRLHNFAIVLVVVVLAAAVSVIRKTNAFNAQLGILERREEEMLLTHPYIQNKYDGSDTMKPGEDVGTTVPQDKTTSSLYQPPLSNASSQAKSITAAMCHKSIFGYVELDRVLKWAKYNYLLGFDHVFIWHQPSVRNYTGFEELERQPYITMVESAEGKVLRLGSKSKYTRLKGKGAVQRDIEKMCLTETAKDFDYVMVADADEFLWFDKKIGLKEFLKRNDGFHYLSFGKYEYAMTHYVDIEEDSGFGLDKYPFTPGTFCNTKGDSGNHICPGHAGRSKIMVKPNKHSQVNVHGYIDHPNATKGEIHLSTEDAHIKEWAFIFLQHKQTLQTKKDFACGKSCSKSISVHNIGTHSKNENGTLIIHYDGELRDWFRFVAGHDARNLSQASRSM
jgi:hypothetical protein